MDLQEQRALTTYNQTVDLACPQTSFEQTFNGGMGVLQHLMPGGIESFISEGKEVMEKLLTTIYVRSGAPSAQEFSK